MSYTSDQIKKEYSIRCDENRAKNLIYLREEIAKKSQKEFRDELGFTSSDMSNIESGKKNLSLYHIHAYKKYFLENHDLEVSTDFIMGYSQIIENKNINLTAELGFDKEVINNLKKMPDKYRFLLNRLIQTNAIDGILNSVSIYCGSAFRSLKLIYDGVSSIDLPHEDVYEFNKLTSYKEFCKALESLRRDENIFDEISTEWEIDNFNAFLDTTCSLQKDFGENEKEHLIKLLNVYKKKDNPGDRYKIEILEKRINDL